MAQKIVTYLRVSTVRQGQSGLGIEAQRAAVLAFLNGGHWKVLGEFVEIETGARNDRVELAKAITLARVHGAKLVIAKLDRLSRDAHFLLGLDKAGVDFVCADMPNANRLTVGIMAMVAEEERRMISSRTKAALQAAKTRGKKLGGNRGATVSDVAREASKAARSAAARGRATDLLPIIREIRAEGAISLRRIAQALMDRGIPSARGGAHWSAVTVADVLSQAGESAKEGMKSCTRF